MPAGRISRTAFVAALATLTLASCDRAAPEQPTAATKPMTWDDLEARKAPVADRSFAYGRDPYQVVDLWLPPGPGPHPVVLMVHGGCWTTGIADRTLMNHVAGDLRKRGIAVWNIDYRGVDRPGGAPDGIFEDVAAAADLLRTQGAAYRLDTRRIVAVGHSAGGHLALWLAARPRLTGTTLPRAVDPLPVRHVVSLGGLPDLEQDATQEQGCGVEPVAKLLGPQAAGDPAVRRYADRSVPRLAPLGVPQTLVNGDADKIIPTRFATDYAAKMRAKGDTVDIRIVRGQGHVELVAPGTPAWNVALATIDQALGRPAVASQ